MPDLSLVGDIGGTNSRFGLVEQGATFIQNTVALKNDDFASLEEAIGQYLSDRGIKSLAAAAIAVAGPVESEVVSLTNRDWSFTRDSLKRAAKAKHMRLLNDFEALAWSLPYLGSEDLVQIGGDAPDKPALKIVFGPGTGLGMAMLAPLPGGGWMALPSEIAHANLPVATQEEFNWRRKMEKPGVAFTTEDAISGGGILKMYRALGPDGPLSTPEAVLKAALAESDEAAMKTLDQFIVWIARVAGDAAITTQARGGVYLAGGIAPSIIGKLQTGPFRGIFENKGKLANMMAPIPVYVITDRFPALTGCAAALIG